MYCLEECQSLKDPIDKKKQLHHVLIPRSGTIEKHCVPSHGEGKPDGVSTAGCCGQYLTLRGLM
jgi:hypothetical protein